MILNELAKKEIIKYVKENRKLIKVRGGKCRYNYRCQNNAVHEAIENNEKKIAMCIYIHNDYPIIHFINVNKKGKFIDNTLGHWCTQYDYYLIRYIEKSDFFKVGEIFDLYRIELRNKLRFFTKLLSNIEN